MVTEGGVALVLEVGRTDLLSSDDDGETASFVTRRVDGPEDVSGALADVDCVVVAPLATDRTNQAVEAVRAEHPDLPVLVVYDAVETGRAALEAGATDVYSTEMLTPPLLVERIAALIDRNCRRQEADLFHVLMDDLPVFLYFKDEDARYTHVGDMVSSYLEGIVGRRTLWPDAGDYVTPAEQQVLEDGEPVLGRELEGTTPVDFHSEWVEETVVPWREDGNIRGIVGLTYDVTTHRHRREALERQNERLERFASIVSHDLRNPINVAQGNLELARAGEEGALEQVSWALTRMEELVNDLLTLARKGQTVDETANVRLEAVATDAWRAIDAPDARLVVECDPDVAVDAHAGRLRELLENLFRNAVEHAGSAVTIRVGELDDSSGFFVEDDGPGIPEALREDVFSSGYTTAEDGTGFGLAIVQSIAQAHGWSIAVADGGGEGPGARFELTDVDLLHGVVDEEEAPDLPTFSGVERQGPRFHVTASGKNLWQFDNEFHFVYAPLGDGESMSARVLGMDAAAGWSKAGLVVRDRLGDHAAQFFVAINATEGSELGVAEYPESPTQTRQLDDGAGTPHWYRLERDGDTVTAFGSADGDTWRELGSERLPLDGAAYAGLFVSSVEETSATTATFDAVHGLSAWEHRDVGDVRIPGDVTVEE